jgi:hypothetical protein
MYIIVKYIKNEKGIELPVIILDVHTEVWEFDSIEGAEKIREILEKNSDSGYRYIVKKIGG